jgi:hypothetical protein
LRLAPLEWSQFLGGRAAPLQRLAGWLARRLAIRVLYCDLPACFLRLADSHAAGLLVALDALLRRVAGEESAQWIAVKELAEDDYRRLELLGRFGYVGLPAMPMNHARPGWNSFEESCAAQTSQHRWTIKRSRKKFTAAGLRVVRITGRDGADRLFTDDVYRLYEAVRDRAEIKLQKVTADYFRELARQLPDETSFTFIYDGDRVVAFTFGLFNAAVYRSILCGLDYDANARSDLYFNLSFAMMDDAYARGVTDDILTGYTADAFKREKLGCHQTRRFVYLKGTRPLVSRLVLRRLKNGSAKLLFR